MKKRLLCLLLAVLVLVGLLGCGRKAPGGQTGQTLAEESAETIEESTEATVPATVPADGNPKDVTCKGSYTAAADPDAVVASMEVTVEETLPPETQPEETEETESATEPEETAPRTVTTVKTAELTNSELQVWYWAEVAAYRQAGHEIAPDFDRPLDTQVCEIDGSVNSWQQYFLNRAVTAWHSAQALTFQGLKEGLPTEEAYQPNLKNHGIYLVDIPATKYLYGYNHTYQPNTMHQEYLDNIPSLLETLAQEKGYGSVSAMAKAAFGSTQTDLEEAVTRYNWAYTYFTNLSYDIELTQEEIDAHYGENKDRFASTGTYVDFRHLLVVPGGVAGESVEVAEDGTVTCSDAAWDAAMQEAETLLAQWSSDWNATEGTFAALTRKESEDPGSTINGGAYRQIRQGQLLPVLDEWCFDEERQPGDTEILRSEYGIHIVYFSGSTQIGLAEAEEDLKTQRQSALTAAARENYPMEISYSAISLTEAEATVSTSDLLYPDVAHERFPEVPLYLQQDYPNTDYGEFSIVGHGCGITTFAMLASYMTDDELTPPEMCARYGNYSFVNGTDGSLFLVEPPVLGFYPIKKTHDHKEAKQALADGYIVISLQHKGYWTRGGHYLLLEEIFEDDTVQVRDSNIYNYHKLHGHYIDRHNWALIPTRCDGFWIFEKKITTIPACSRCGDPEGVMQSLLEENYTCEKCRPAILRRDTYLNACGA